MYKKIVSLGFLVYFAADAANAQTQSASEIGSMLREINGTSIDSHERRFTFITQRMINSCSDYSIPVNFADAIVTLHQRMLGRAGLDSEESLLDSANNIYSIIVTLDNANRLLISCDEAIATYGTLRQQGMSQEDAVKSFTDLILNLPN